MKSYGFILSGICVAGCMASNSLEYEAVSENNLYHIAKIRKGMSEGQAIQIMGKPYDYESFQVDDDIYDVWFYVTRTTGLDQTRMVPQNLTPLTFKNGILVGTGYYWYYFAMRESSNAEARENGLPEEKTSTPRGDGEDLNLEKALKAPNQTPAPPAKPVNPPSKPIQNNATSKQPASSSQNTTSNEAPSLSSEALPVEKVKAVKSFQSSPVSVKSGIQLQQLGLFGAVHVEQLSKVKIGMSEPEVKRILGSGLNRETIQVKSDVYEVVFYEVSSRMNQPAQVVPFTFKNGFLVEMTEEYYEQIKESSMKPNEVKESVDGYDKEAERMEEDSQEQNFNYW